MLSDKTPIIIPARGPYSIAITLNIKQPIPIPKFENPDGTEMNLEHIINANKIEIVTMFFTYFNSLKEDFKQFI